MLCCLCLIQFALLYGVFSADEFGTCGPSVTAGKSADNKIAALRKISSLVQKDFKSEFTDATSGDSYTFNLNICGTGVGNSSDYVAVQQTKNGHLGGHWVLGLNSEMTATSGSQWVLLTFFGGDQYNSHCNGEKRKTFVMVTCPAGNHVDGELVVVNEYSEDHDCYYMLELFSNQMCSVSGWGAFGILIFTFFLIFILYFLVGLLLNRCRGAQGCNQIPHLGFWSSFGHRIADGCDYFCRCQGPPEDEMTRNLSEHDEAILPM